jgi:hypothetical protein
MSFWIGFWTAVLFFAVASLTGLAIVVTVGGFFDVKKMFKSIDSKHRVEDSAE